MTKKEYQLYFRKNSKRLEVLALQKRAQKRYKYVLLSHWYKDVSTWTNFYLPVAETSLNVTSYLTVFGVCQNQQQLLKFI